LSRLDHVFGACLKKVEKSLLTGDEG